MFGDELVFWIVVIRVVSLSPLSLSTWVVIVFWSLFFEGETRKAWEFFLKWENPLP